MRAPSQRRLPISRFGRREADAAYGIASLLLRYPDAPLIEAIPQIDVAIRGLPRSLGRPFLDACGWMSATPSIELQENYVATFDLNRRCCLYLSYYLNGDTRRRGGVLWSFQQAFRGAGRSISDGELPDYLPALLELCATGAREPAQRLMCDHRAGILVLQAALEELGSPYAGVVRVVDALLPASTARMLAAAEQLARDGPPTELVGIDDFSVLAPYGSAAGGSQALPVGVQHVRIRKQERP